MRRIADQRGIRIDSGSLCDVSSELYELTHAKPVLMIAIWNRRQAAKVRLGDLWTNSYNDDARPAVFNIIDTIKHPYYKRPSKYNDIALFRLNRRATFNHYVRPACLPQTFETGTKSALATGWGAEEYAGDSSPQLLKVGLELYSGKECNQTFLGPSFSASVRNGIEEETQICAGSHHERKDTCQVNGWALAICTNFTETLNFRVTAEVLSRYIIVAWNVCTK